MDEHKLPELEPTITERRRQTRHSIYMLIYHADTAPSRAEIAEKLHLSLPTVNLNLTQLMEAGLVREGERKKSTGGRRPVGYEIVDDVRLAIGASISANAIGFVLCNLKLDILKEKSIPNDCDADPDLAGTFESQLQNFLQENEIPEERLLGIGLTIPGIYDEKTDQVVISPTMKMKNVSLKDLVNRSRVPIRVVNDSTAAGEAELFCTKIDRRRDFVYLLLENGIGGAAYVNGKVYEGNNGRSAEFGHMRIVPGGRLCNCGQRGCLEAYCSALRFTRDIGLTPEEFFEKVKTGDPACRELFEDVLDHLALGIVNIRMAFDCDIVLGGFVAEYLGPYLDMLRRKVQDLDPFERDASYVRLTKIRSAGRRGAAASFLNPFLDTI